MYKKLFTCMLTGIIFGKQSVKKIIQLTLKTLIELFLRSVCRLELAGVTRRE